MSWKRVKGQFQLVEVKSGSSSLFSATYSSEKVVMNVWPGTVDSYQLTLTLSEYLLKSIVRSQNDKALRKVQCEYSADPTLDYILTCLVEEDGSIEKVTYEAQGMKFPVADQPGLPRVTRHVIMPGAGQENIITDYQYSENNYLLKVPMLGVDPGKVDIEKCRGTNLFLGFYFSVREVSRSSEVSTSVEYFYNRLSEKFGELVASDKNTSVRYWRYGFVDGIEREVFCSDFLSFLAEAWDCRDDEGEYNSDVFMHILGYQVLRERKADYSNVEFSKIWDKEWGFYGEMCRLEHADLGSELSVRFLFLNSLFADFVGSFRYWLNDREGEVVKTYDKYTYNHSGQLIKRVEPDKTITEWQYYPQGGGTGLSLNGLAGVNAEALKALTLTCPAIEEPAQPPIMAMFQYQWHQFKRQPLGLTLYGYEHRACNARSVLVANHIVALDGVIADADDWGLSLAEGYSTAVIHHEKLSESVRKPKTGNTGGKVSVWSSTSEKTTWFGNEKSVQKNTLSWEDNPQEKGLLVRTEARSEVAQSILATEVRCRRTRRRLVRRTEGQETRWTYDALGRVTLEERYPLKPGTNKADEKASANASLSTVYEVTEQGIFATTTDDSGRITRVLRDGLQREVSQALKVTGAERWCLLDEMDYSSQGTLNNHTRYDYWPGGLRRALESNGERQALTFDQRGIWKEEKVYGYAGISSTSTEVIGVGKRTLQTRTKTREQLDDGGISHTFTQESASGLSRTLMVKEFDHNGHLSKVTRGSGDAEQTLQFERDELGRVTQITQPNGTKINRSYFGLSTQVIELKVNDTVMGTQEITAPSRLKSRTIGTRRYQFADNKVTLPDKRELTHEATDDGTTRTLSISGTKLSSVANDATGKTTTLSTHEASGTVDAFKFGSHSESQTLPGLFGQLKREVKTPRATRKAWELCSTSGFVLAALRSDGRYVRSFHDRQQRLLRHYESGIDQQYRYADTGQLQEQTVVAAQSASRLSTRYSYDDFGQETARDYQVNGASVLSLKQEWTSEGLLKDKTLTRDGKQVRKESFSHDSLDRLTEYSCVAAEAKDCPADEQGKRVKKQAFTWDGLMRLEKCITTYADDATQTQTYTFDAANPTQCSSVDTDGEASTLTWTSNGFLEENANGQKLAYNEQGQLKTVKDKDGKLLSQYAYDGYGRLAAQYVAADKQTCELCYDGEQLCGEVWFDSEGKEVKRVALGVAQVQQVRDSAGTHTAFLLEDPHSGIVGYCQGADIQLSAFTAFGENGALLANSRRGYNGERLDPVTHAYHLGNGYRTYSPHQRSFQQPDSKSPFGEGGVNEYAYCCNPIDLHDPSGHIMISRWGEDRMIADLNQTLRDTQPQPVGSFWRGIALSAAMAVMGIALAAGTGGASLFFFVTTALSLTALALEVAGKIIEDTDPETARRLGIASMVFGFASIGNFASLPKQALKGLRWAATQTGQLLKKIQAGVRLGVRQVLKRWGEIKRYGFKAAAALRASSKSVLQQRKGWLSRSEFMVDLGNGEAHTVKGIAALAEWYFPNVVRVTRPVAKAMLVGSAKLFKQVPSAVSSALEVKVYRDTVAGIDSLINPQAMDEVGEGGSSRTRWESTLAYGNTRKATA
ncbi:RHS repeat domain-containing protein [Pseudomonas fontis]|uniref:Teneurin-like YD-shell domain-containing protein n=1 Tax=Pseudomonas fontis TaxID=2942633 RepID=A0ABT5NZA6_9PSED|nr:RHS repeat-associated core domain-containing protein [Pseudomonas fontis]MDD0977565.1 hypothetical protein [Pseudomonas fontis]MDD0993457.1 hypothetical protein [Pseudomonas fontis]